ncbi:MAG: heavy-metal-associated domain-containing protein [Caldisericia bacterium]|nr:heavy-metal-associated domain-containing protein [Caldisericia bacterium]
MTATITSKRIMCGGCAANVTKALSSLEGVKSVNVDVPTKTVSVEFDDSITNIATLREAMATAGYMPD